MSNPIVALVVDEDGNVVVRVSGDPVTVVWVSEHTPHDRVYEVRSREAGASLADYLGAPEAWGHEGDETQSRVKLRMMGTQLRLVPKRGEQ